MTVVEKHKQILHSEICKMSMGLKGFMVSTRRVDVVLNAVTSQQEGPLCMELHVTCGFSGVSGFPRN